MAVLRMASPTKDPRTGMLYLNVRVPADLASQLAGQAVTLPIGAEFKSVNIGKTVVKASMGTKDNMEGRARFAAAHAALLFFWETQRRTPEGLRATGQPSWVPCKS